MKDAQFKSLIHPVGRNIVATCGTTVAPGYKPDITVRCPHGTLKYIIEAEQKTDRKAFLGDLMKAEMFAEQVGAHPELVIVMQPFKNTTTKQIANHLDPYVQWLSRLKSGRLSLSAVHILSDVEYQMAIGSGVQLGSQAFKMLGHVV